MTKVANQLSAPDVIADQQGDENKFQVEPHPGKAITEPEPGPEEKGEEPPWSGNAIEELSFHRFKPTVALLIMGHGVVDEKTGEIEEASKPGHHENDVQGLNPEHRSCL